MTIEAATRGLVMGDSLSNQNATHRLGLISERRVRRFNILQSFATENRHTTLPEAYVHGFSPKYLFFKPSDDIEWFCWSRNIVLNQLDFEIEWKSMAIHREALRLRVSVASALQNLSDGLDAPASGHDNPHYFDNASMFRALGIFAAKPTDIEEIRRFVSLDASHTNSEDGLWCAMATGVLAASVFAGSSIEEAINEAIKELPEGSWSRREVLKALEISRSQWDLKERIILLEERFVDRIYPYPYSAPETLGLLLAHLQHKEDPYSLFASSFLHRRNTDSIPGLIGFFLGLQYGPTWLPEAFRMREIRIDGVSIPSLKGALVI